VPIYITTLSSFYRTLIKLKIIFWKGKGGVDFTIQPRKIFPLNIFSQEGRFSYLDRHHSKLVNGHFESLDDCSCIATGAPKKIHEFFGSQAKIKNMSFNSARLLHHDNDKIQCFEFDLPTMPFVANHHFYST